MGLTKTGDIIYRSKFSRCEVCEFFIKDYKCEFEDYINAMCWCGFDSHRCEKFNSIIKQLNNHFVFRDYCSMKPIERNKYKFNSKGEKI